MKPPVPKPHEPDAIDRLAASIYMAGPADFKPEDEVLHGERPWAIHAKVKMTARLIRAHIAANYEPRRK